jgi:DHA2 family methylenomycin A resistance protein-like MFS transporter
VAQLGGRSLVVGPLAGGVLITMFDWRSIFLVNVPSASRGSG